MRIFRGLLTAGWIVLIVSLFWDPVTPQMTMPDNVGSPFHLQGKTVMVQGQVMTEAPYHMTNRIFWTMLIPVLPLFFMVAGHEAWRRICPLSFVSQIPRYFGLNRKRSVLIKRTGQIEKQLALVGRDTWWRKNVWYIQFGLLFLALNARILFVNSDRTALGLFFIGIIVLAIAVGYFWGGKTWCNYVCPVAIVQKIYTEPRGLFESQAHITRAPVSQSMCRTSTPEGERSTCVGCTANCPDIDLERSYWESIEDPALRYVYYGFFGLIVGFYSFYYFYSGGWDYYFSGAWTHEPDQLGSVFKSGLYIDGRAYDVPKIISSPLILGSFVAMAMAVGKGLEFVYRQIVKRAQLPLTEPEIVSRCLSFSAYLSINVFYLFGGRPNLMLLPGPALRVIDIMIVALTTLWFWQAIQRNPTQFRREGLAASLRDQLRKLNVDISKFLEGRKLEELKPDEVYVLAKTLPNFSREQRMQAYRNILEEALRTGKTDTSASLELLREVRVEVGVSDDEHRQILQEFGIDGADGLLDPDKAATFENWIRLDNYRRVIEPILLGQLDLGHKLSGPLQDSVVANTVKEYRAIYHVSEVEHANVLANITGAGGLMFERAKRQLSLLADDAALVFGLRCKMLADHQWQAIGCLLIASTVRRTNVLCAKLFAMLMTLGNTPEARLFAAEMAELVGEGIEKPLALPVTSGTRVTWANSLDAYLVNLLRGSRELDGDSVLKLEDSGFHSVIEKGGELALNLKRTVATEDPLVGALALTAISYLDLGLAQQIASEIERHDTSAPRLMTDVIDGLIGKSSTKVAGTPDQTFTITLATPNNGQQVLSFMKDHVTVGRAADNDVAIFGQVISPYHLTISRQGQKVQVRRTDHFSSLFVNGVALEGDMVAVESGARLSFLPTHQQGPVLVIEWANPSTDYTIESHDTVTKLLWLSSASIFRELDLGSLTEIAASVEIRRYAKDVWLCHAGEAAKDAFLLQAGSADVLIERDGQTSLIGKLQEGALIGELGVITGRPRVASARISSPMARVLTIQGERLRALMERDSTVSMSMLTVVAGYVKN